ncbi:hypothetical protein LINPERPRIM_LOCUS39836, partial [Linum perenne]
YNQPKKNLPLSTFARLRHRAPARHRREPTLARPHQRAFCLAATLQPPTTVMNKPLLDHPPRSSPAATLHPPATVVIQPLLLQRKELESRVREGSKSSCSG